MKWLVVCYNPHKPGVDEERTESSAGWEDLLRCCLEYEKRTNSNRSAYYGKKFDVYINGVYFTSGGKGLYLQAGDY